MSPMSLVELFIGMAFLYLLLSIVCSAVQEWLAQRSGARGQLLRQGLLRLIEDRWFYLRVINHPSMAALYRDLPGKPRPPAYAPPESFASAILDTLLNKAAKLDPETVPLADDHSQANLLQAAKVCAAHGFAVGYALQPLIAAAKDDEAVKTAVGDWYQATMDRTSGWYKRIVQKRLLVLGFIAAAAFNVDSITVALSLLKSNELSHELADLATKAAPALGEQVSGAVKAEVQDTLSDTARQIEGLREAGLPVGYGCLAGIASDNPVANYYGLAGLYRECRAGFTTVSWPSIILHIIGWLITGFAVSFGAPFWFDALNKFVNIRGTGVKPKPQDASAST